MADLNNNTNELQEVLSLLDEKATPAGAEVTYDTVVDALGYVPLSTGGGAITGGLTAGGDIKGNWITGAWLRTTNTTALNADKLPVSRVCVLDDDGWIYTRSATGLLEDMGGVFARFDPDTGTLFLGSTPQ